jgi:hypothetical protein
VSTKLHKRPVTVRALIQRINRKLAPDYRKIMKCRENANGWDYLGEYYVVDLLHNNVVDTHVDLKKIAVKLKAMGEWETVVNN